MSQCSGESISDYLAELRRLSTHCNFNDLGEALRDRLVCGLTKETVQKKLLTEADLTLAKATQIAQAHESATANARSLHQVETPLHQLSLPRKKSLETDQPCRHCGRTNHESANCRYKLATCHSCGKQGHIAPICRTRNGTSKAPSQKPHPSRRQQQLE